MAIIRSDYALEEITERSVADLLCGQEPNYFKFRNFFYREFEADVFIVTKARYATEFEIKISLSDWKADVKKKKHGDIQHIKYFWYVVPLELIDKAPEGISPKYGIKAFYNCERTGRLLLKHIKNPEVLSNKRLPISIFLRAFLSTYYRHGELNYKYSAVLRDYQKLIELHKQLREKTMTNHNRSGEGK